MRNQIARDASKQEGCPALAFVDDLPDGTQKFGLFGWEGAAVDRAISADNIEALKWCLEYKLCDKDTKTLVGTTLRSLCVQRAPKCAEHLASIGFPL